MPRSNRPRGTRSGGAGPGDGDEERDLSRALSGTQTTQTRRDGVWNLQTISAPTSTKHYICPGCGLQIVPGTPHLVAWRADGLMGAADDLAARRHWHTHCWKIA